MLNSAAGNVEFTISPVSSLPESLIVVDSAGAEDNLIGKTRDDDVWNGKASITTPVSFADNSIKFTLAYSHAETSFVSFRIA